MEIARNRPGSSPSSDEKIRVMLVDDSAVVRGLITRWLGTEKDIEIVAQSRNGLQAIKDAQQYKPQVIVLDIEMPEMDGLEALPTLLKSSPHVRVLIASSLSQRNAKISLTALSKGAHDYVPKPTTNSGLTTSDDFRVELISKIYALCGRSTGPAEKGRCKTSVYAISYAFISARKTNGISTTFLGEICAGCWFRRESCQKL